MRVYIRFLRPFYVMVERDCLFLAIMHLCVCIVGYSAKLIVGSAWQTEYDIWKTEVSSDENNINNLG